MSSLGQPGWREWREESGTQSAGYSIEHFIVAMYSPAFAIPSGLGPNGSVLSPMDAFRAPQLPQSDGSSTLWGSNPRPMGASPQQRPDTSRLPDRPTHPQEGVVADDLFHQFVCNGGWSPLADGLQLLPMAPLGPFPPGLLDSAAMLTELMTHLTEGPDNPTPPQQHPPDMTQSGDDEMTFPAVPPDRGGERTEGTAPPSSRTRSSSSTKAPAFCHEPYQF